MSTIRVYNHVMHKLENLSAQVLDRRPAVRQLWSHAVNPFRRQLFNTLYANHRYVQAFAGGLPGGRLELPRMDNWSLGLWTSPNYEADRPSTLDLSRPALSQVHTVLLIDDSISMTERGIPSWGSGSSRWHQVGGLISDLAPIVTQYDPQGMDMHFLNHRNSQQGLRSSEDVQAIFSRVRPTGGAPLGRCVCTILGAYMATLRYERNLKPLNLVIITDGKVDDEFVLLSTLQEHVSRIVDRGHPAHQLGIEFLQVGNCRQATRHLHRIEEIVRSDTYDVVGVTPVGYGQQRMSVDMLTAVILSGIDARVNHYLRKKRINV